VVDVVGNAPNARKRPAAGKSQRQVARELGVSEFTVRKVRENARNARNIAPAPAVKAKQGDDEFQEALEEAAGATGGVQGAGWRERDSGRTGSGRSPGRILSAK
jgi:predicted transcriptional regulator